MRKTNNIRRILLIFIIILTHSPIFSQDVLNLEYTCKKSTQTAKSTPENQIINSEDYFYKNLEINFIKVDLDLGIGKIQIFDNDRKKYFEFELQNTIPKETGFFKLPSQNNETYAIVTFNANSGTSLVKIYYCIHTKSDKTLLMIKSNHKIENSSFIVEDWYFDLVKR